MAFGIGVGLILAILITLAMRAATHGGKAFNAVGLSSAVRKISESARRIRSTH
jgi:hypothetical protein